MNMSKIDYQFKMWLSIINYFLLNNIVSIVIKKIFYSHAVRNIRILYTLNLASQITISSNWQFHLLQK